jgi:hypothetical protein
MLLLSAQRSAPTSESSSTGLLILPPAIPSSQLSQFPYPTFKFNYLVIPVKSPKLASTFEMTLNGLTVLVRTSHDSAHHAPV